MPEGSTIAITRGSKTLDDEDLLEKDDQILLTLSNGTKLTYTIGELVVPTRFLPPRYADETGPVADCLRLRTPKPGLRSTLL